MFEELVGDWSFLNSTPGAKISHRITAIDAIIAAGEDIMILGLLRASSPRENHDSVRCWHGVDAVSERFSPFDSAFVCYFPAMGVSIVELLRSLARRCSPGARVVIGKNILA
ncbi:uncharacterized protein LOC144706604 [Wolffia australiana]